jgi:hypothetical protein
MRTPHFTAWMLTAWLASVGSAHAGRPLATEDAGVNPTGQCQLESWVDVASDGHHAHFAPACGVLDGLELGFEAVVDPPATEHAQARALALKWAPEWLQWQDWRFGLKAGTMSQKYVGETGWHHGNWSVLGIASLPINDEWTLHLNAGHQHSIESENGVVTYGAAMTWSPHPRWQLFGEINGERHSPTNQTVGMRWWLIPDQLGLDVTGSRTNATADSRAWGVGIGWYGLHF